MKKAQLELIVLGKIMACTLNSPVLIEAMLTLKESDFSVSNRDLFLYLKNRFEENLPVIYDEVVIESLESSIFDIIIACNTYSSSNTGLQRHVDTLKTENKVSSLRDYHKTLANILSSGKSPSERINEAFTVPQPLAVEEELQKGSNYAQVFSDFMAKYHEKTEIGELTGFKNLDDLLCLEGNGMQKGSLLVVMGGTKQGKSALAASIFNNRITTDTSSLVFTLEIDKQQFMLNTLAQKLHIPRKELMLKNDSNEIAEKLFKSSDFINNPNALIYDNPDIDLNFIVQMSRLQARKAPIKTIMVDYLTLMRRPNIYQSPHEDWGHIVKTLRKLAKELGCIMILVSQVNRDVSKRSNQRPLRTDVRDCPQLEYDCHLMLGTFIDSREIQGRPKQMEVSIILNRNGVMHKTAYFDFDGNLKEKTQEAGEAYNAALNNKDETPTFSSRYSR